MLGAKKTYDGKIAGLYDLEETLGRGHFAVVKLARHVFTGEKVAVKVIDKTKLDEVSRAHLFQEVRCMKLVQHPNVVRLYEVIDTQTKLYLILELGDGGDLYDYIMKHEAGLGEDMAKEYFRQIVRAISYCHQLHVVHRDLKPENVVFFERLGVVKLTDFGFSNKFCPGQKLDTSCGSLAYSAPEILLGDSYDAPAVDVWSLGVILYMLVAGQAPFQEANDSETLTMIMDCKYTIPTHVSEACKNLIAKMLVREPEYRATLEDIASDPWLGGPPQVEYLPLVSRHQVTDEDHNIIINKMVNGNIATKEEVLEALDRNEYNHITATYFLLAERKLRTYRQEQSQNKTKESDNMSSITTGSKNSLGKAHSADSTSIEGLHIPQLKYTLNVPRTPGETSQGKVRKCSIVQEEEDEEEYCAVVGGGQELTPPHSSLNRRGSRSEGKLNIAIQERIAEERRKEKKESPVSLPHGSSVARVSAKDDANWPTKRTSPTTVHSGIPAPYIPGSVTRRVYINKTASTQNSVLDSKSILKDGPLMVDNKNAAGDSRNLFKRNDCRGSPSFKITVQKVENTKVYSSQEYRSEKCQSSQQPLDFNEVSLKDSVTIAIPIRGGVSNGSVDVGPKYKTMPSPTRTSASEPVGESFNVDNRGSRKSITSINYEQRRSKFHKARTASCSSSDASDDDSESRKKRAHKISMEKNQRRDSHDDSSGHQDRSGNGGVGGNPASDPGSGGDGMHNQDQSTGGQGSRSTGGSDQSTGTSHYRQCNGETFRRSRRRTGETRLRESQSLNRIMEVQESESANYSSSNAEVFRERVKKSECATSKENSENYGSDKSKAGRSLGARFLQSWSNTISSTRLSVQKRKLSAGDGRTSRGGDANSSDVVEQLPKNHSDEKENKALIEKTGKKMKVLGRYFQVSKKLCIPIPNISTKGRLYKARSCGSISKDRITLPVTSGMSTLKGTTNGMIVQSKRDRGESVYSNAKSKSNSEKNQSIQAEFLNGNTNSLKRCPTGGRYGGRIIKKESANLKEEESEGDVNKNVSNSKESFNCGSVAVSRVYTGEAAKCRFS